MKPILVVMAAGLGSRYGGLKQMDPVGPNGEWLLEYSIYDAISAGFEKVVFIINKKIESDFKILVGKKLSKYIEIEYVIQDLNDIPSDIPEGRIKPWGTAHAVYTTRYIIEGPFVVINADDYYGKDAYKKIFDFLMLGQDEFALIAYELKKTLTHNGSVARGICSIENDMLTEIVERTHIKKLNDIVYIEDNKTYKLDENSVVSMNIWGFTTAIINEIESGLLKFLNTVKLNPMNAEYYLPRVVDNMIKCKKINVKVIKTKEQWFGVTYPEDKDHVIFSIDALIDQGSYPRNLWEG